MTKPGFFGGAAGAVKGSGGEQWRGGEHRSSEGTFTLHSRVRALMT